MTSSLALMILLANSPPDDVAIRNSPPAIVQQAAENNERSAEIRRMKSRERALQRRLALRNAPNRSLKGGQQQAMDGLISLIQSSIAPDCWEFGGTGFSGGSGAGNGSSTSRQNAENLVDLIQQTTRPLSWEINGGNGSISIFSN